MIYDNIRVSGLGYRLSSFMNEKHFLHVKLLLKSCNKIINMEFINYNMDDLNVEV